MIFFIEKNQYKFLIGKSLTVDQLTEMLKGLNDTDLKKYITPLAYYKLLTINTKLNTLLSSDIYPAVYSRYVQSLTNEEEQHILGDIYIGFNTATQQGDTEKYYEVIKAPNGDILITYDNYIAKHMSDSKDNMLALLRAVMEKEYNAGLLYPELFKKYLSVCDSAFNTNIVKLKLLNFH